MNDNDLLAPPSEEELSDLMAAPSEDELGSVDSVESSDIGALGSGIGAAGAIYAGQKGLEVAKDKLPELSQELAYKAIGGTSTPTGRDFVKKESKDFLDTAFLDTKDIGKRALEENMLGTLGLSGSKKQSELSRLLAEKDMLEKQKLMSRAEAAGAKVSSQDLLDQFSKIRPQLNELEERSEIGQLDSELERLKKQPKTKEQLSKTQALETNIDSVTGNAITNDVLKTKTRSSTQKGDIVTNIDPITGKIRTEDLPIDIVTGQPIASDTLKTKPFSSTSSVEEFLNIDPSTGMPISEKILDVSPVSYNQKNLEFTDIDQITGMPKTPEQDLYNLADIEKAKTIAQEQAYNKKSKSERNVLEKGRAKAYKESTEQAVKKSLGEEALEEFQRLKGKSGESQIIRDIAAEKLAQSRLAPSLSTSELGIGGLISPKAALAYRALKEKGAGIAARTAETGGNLLTGAAELAGKIPGAKTLYKNAPLIGGLAAASSGYSDARVEGSSIPSSLAQGAKEAVLSEVLPLPVDLAREAYKSGKFPLMPEAGPKAGSPEAQLESGKIRELPISPELEKNRVLDSKQKNTVAPTLRDPKELQNLLSQYQQMKGTSKSVDVYGQQLERYAQTEDPQEKGRIEYSLAQQPAFKDLLKKSKSVAPELIKRHETFQPNVYDDGAGNQTVGYGHKLTPEEIQSGQYKNLTEEQAQELMYKDMENTQNLIQSKVPNYDQLPQNQKDAIMSYVFNAGNNAFRNNDGTPTNFAQYLQSGDMDSAIGEMDIVKSGDKVMPGLIKRRAQEQYLAKRKAK